MSKYKVHISNILFVGFFLYFVFFTFHGFHQEKKIKENGIEIEATVFRCEKISWPPVRSGRRWISKAYYQVEGVTNPYSVEAVLPIGMKFKIKYLPNNPHQALLSDEHQFDNYPKDKKEDN